MRASYAVLGAGVWTNVSGERRRCRIVMVDTRPETGRSGRTRRVTRYELRDGDGKTLPKLRTARELHFCAHRGEWPGLSEVADTLAGACDRCRAWYLDVQ